MSEILHVERRDEIGVLTLSRPRRLNALSNALVRQIGDCLHELQGKGVRAAVLTGDERAFAAGADIAELSDPGPDLAAWDRIWDLECVTIGAVRGMALGGGLELAMSCDLLVVADDARLGQPEISLGVMPGAGGTQRLTRALGKTLAMEMILLGREIDGRTAYSRGLANASVPPERVLPAAVEFAERVARQAPIAVRRAKAAVLDAFETPLSTGLRRERESFTALLGTDDAREGIAAFVGKRRATWSNR